MSAITPGKKKLQQIGQVLVGENANDNRGFERILRLKKEVLKELHSIRVALLNEHNNAGIQSVAVLPGSVVKGKDRPAVSREMLLKEAKHLQHRLGSCLLYTSDAADD